MAKKVVVLGGGFAGAFTAQKLEKKIKDAEITVVDRREGLLAKYATLRAVVYGDAFSHRVMVPENKMLKRGKVVQANVNKVEPGKVSLDDGTELEYDFLVCATGSHNKLVEPPSSVTSKKETMAFFEDFSTKIKEAKKILIVGGGPSAVELVGEIADRYGNSKDITIATAAKGLVDNVTPTPPKKFYNRVNKLVKNAGVKVVTGNKVDVKFDNNVPYLLEQTLSLAGEEQTFDLVIQAVGFSLNTEIYPAAWKNDRGALKVRPTLQLVGEDNVFALGDLTDLNEIKLAYLAETQAGVVSKNLATLIKNGTSLKEYKVAKTAVMLLPFGRNKGVTVFSGLVIGNTMTSLGKGKSLFIPRIWGQLGQKNALKKETKVA